VAQLSRVSGEVSLREAVEIMADIIDVQGASGDFYRFTKEALSGSGNFIIMSNETDDIICSGTTSDLNIAMQFWKNMPNHKAATTFYTRRNVTKSMRQAEHDDICLKHAPEMVVFEFDGSR